VTADVIRDRIIAAGLATGAVADGSAWVCLVGGLSDRVRAPQIAVRDTAGYAPLDTMDGPGVRRAGVQVLVRGNAGDYAGTAVMAKAAWDVLHTARFGPILSVRGMNGPTWLGYTSDEARPQWSMNLIAFTTE
jgi:hypothetical protein